MPVLVPQDNCRKHQGIGPDGNMWHIEIGTNDTVVPMIVVRVLSYLPDGTRGDIDPTSNGCSHPGVPVSGTNYVVLQVNTTTGMATEKDDTTDYPIADDGNILIARQQVSSTDGAIPSSWSGWQFLI